MIKLPRFYSLGCYFVLNYLIFPTIDLIQVKKVGHWYFARIRFESTNYVWGKRDRVFYSWSSVVCVAIGFVSGSRLSCMRSMSNEQFSTFVDNNFLVLWLYCMLQVSTVCYRELCASICLTFVHILLGEKSFKGIPFFKKFSKYLCYHYVYFD